MDSYSAASPCHQGPGSLGISVPPSLASSGLEPRGCEKITMASGITHELEVGRKEKVDSVGQYIPLIKKSRVTVNFLHFSLARTWPLV